MNLFHVLALLGLIPTVIAMVFLARATREKRGDGTAIMGTATVAGVAWILACTIASNPS